MEPTLAKAMPGPSYPQVKTRSWGFISEETDRKVASGASGTPALKSWSITGTVP